MTHVFLVSIFSIATARWAEHGKNWLGEYAPCTDYKFMPNVGKYSCPWSIWGIIMVPGSKIWNIFRHHFGPQKNQ